MGIFGSKPVAEPEVLNESPWRKIDWKGKDKLLDQVNNLQPQNENCKHVRILLHGPVGSGKSSFVNSVSSALRGRKVHDAHVDNAAGTSYTIAKQTHKIPKGKPHNFYPFVFNDMMGLEDLKGIHEEDIKLALSGHVKDGYTFNPEQQMKSDHPLYNADPTPDDKTHVLVSVIPAQSVSMLQPELMAKMRRIRLVARNLGIPQICIITKIDEAHPFMEKDIQNVYKMKIVKEKMEEFSSKVGIPMDCIFPVKNYHEETDLDDDIDILVLRALKQMINFGEDFINKHYPE